MWRLSFPVLKSIKLFVSILLILVSTFIFCEFLIYYIYLSLCSWPILSNNNRNNVDQTDSLKAVFIADIHLLGVRHGHWFDKLRREWQMYQSFQIMMRLHNPDIVFILGDVFDEASFSHNDIYEKYVSTFYKLFKIDVDKEMYIVAGNHDIGFHYIMKEYPILESRFRKTMNSQSVQIITKKNIHFVLINSMALEQDGCDLCKKVENRIERISEMLKCANGTQKCSKSRFNYYSRPIILMHFPLYRKSDSNCVGWDTAPFYTKHTHFKQKWDCLSDSATKFLLDKLHPRVVFTAHTHYGCITKHKLDIKEYTVPSFNWRNKFNPSFIMSTINAKEYENQLCFLPNEFLVIGLYILSFTVSLILIIRTILHLRRKEHQF